jgi:carbonic anhydrase
MKRLACLLSLIVFFTPAISAQQSAPPTAAKDQLWDDLAAGNARFVDGKPNGRNLVADRSKLAKTQSPKVAVVACSDSRVAPELLFDKTLGDLFVVRDAGNSPDPVAIGSLEYAVEHLGTTMIVVMGHQECGAVKAACSGGHMPTANLEAVVRPIQASCSLAKGKDLDPAARDHVHRSALKLLEQSPILKKHVAEKKLTIVEAFYSLDSGKVERLD